MNLLIVRRPGEAEQFSASFQRLSSPGTSFATQRNRPGVFAVDYQEQPELAQDRHILRDLKWTAGPAPSAIVYVLTGICTPGWDARDLADRLVNVAMVAVRDNCVLFVVVPTIQTEVAEKFVRAIETLLFNKSSNVFFLHKADVDQEPAKLAGLVLKLSDTGMFGRYQVTKNGSGFAMQIGVQPMLLRTALRAPVTEAFSK